MHDLYRLKENLVKELEELGKQDLSKSSLDTVDKLAHAAKNVAKVIECCEEDEYSNAMGYSRRGGYSRRNSYADGMSYRDMSYADGRSYANDGSDNFVRPDGSYRDGGMSYARGRGAGAKRDAMGRYSRAEDETIMQLEQLMDTAQDEHTRKEIRKILDRM